MHPQLTSSRIRRDAERKFRRSWYPHGVSVSNEDGGATAMKDGMKKRQLGRWGLEVSELGLGCMGMSEFYGAGDRRECEATIDRALEMGVTFLDTSDIYGPFTN
jgi:hypothetical protein